jgi:hypothetical protein
MASKPRQGPYFGKAIQYWQRFTSHTVVEETSMDRTTDEAPQPGDLLYGFVVIGSGPELGAAYERLREAQSVPGKHTEAVLKSDLALVQSYELQALSSPAGRAAFPAMAESAVRKGLIPPAPESPSKK